MRENEKFRMSLHEMDIAADRDPEDLFRVRPPPATESRRLRLARSKLVAEKQNNWLLIRIDGVMIES